MKKIIQIIGGQINVTTIILAILLIFSTGISFQSCKDKIDTLNEYKRVLALKDQEIKQYKDDIGRTHTVIQEITAEKEIIQEVFKQTIDSVAKIVNVKDKQIKEYTEIISKTKGSGTGKLKIVRDTVYADTSSIIIDYDDEDRTMEVDDGYLKFNATIKPDLTYNYKYTYTDSIGIVKYYKRRKGFLRFGKDTYIDVFSANKNTEITSAKQFKVSELDKPKRYSLTVGPGASWDFQGRIKPTVNATLGITILRF